MADTLPKQDLVETIIECICSCHVPRLTPSVSLSAFQCNRMAVRYAGTYGSRLLWPHMVSWKAFAAIDSRTGEQLLFCAIAALAFAFASCRKGGRGSIFAPRASSSFHLRLMRISYLV